MFAKEAGMEQTTQEQLAGVAPLVQPALRRLAQLTVSLGTIRPVAHFERAVAHNAHVIQVVEALGVGGAL